MGRRQVVGLDAGQLLELGCGAQDTPSAFTDYRKGLPACGQLGVHIGPRSHFGQPARLNLSTKCLPIIDLALGSEHALLLTSTRQILAFGHNAKGQLGLGKQHPTTATSSPTHIAELQTHKILKIKAAGNTSAALSDNGNLFVWGEGIWGRFLDANRVRGFSHSAEKDISI